MGPEFESGRYRLQERLSPEGDAWLAEDLEDGVRPVVVKFLPERADAISARHLVETLEGLDSQVLSVPLDEGETSDGRTFLVFRYVEGHNLRVVLNESGPLSFRRCAHLLVQLGEALGRLHERGLVHAAMCPEHIMVHHSHGHDVLTLLHGGVFRVTRETSVSPAYLAPEHLAGEPTHSSDLFSTAAVAAEMLTGRRAFRYGSLDELHHMQRRGIQRGGFRQLRAKLPLRVEDELRRALAWDPAQRPADVRVLTTRLAESLGGGRGIPTRRLALLGALGLAVISMGVRNCRRRWAGQ